MRKTIVNFILILLVIFSCTCAYSGVLGDWIGGVLGTDDYHNGPKDIQRQNKLIDDAMKERQKRIDEEDQRKKAVEDEKQKRIEEFEQEKVLKYQVREAALKRRYLDEYVNKEEYQYIVKAEDYNGIINNLVNRVKAMPNGNQIKASKVTKENTGVAAIIYSDIDDSFNVLKNILNAVEEEERTIEKNTPIRSISFPDSKKRACVDSIIREHYAAVESGKILNSFEGNKKAADDAYVKCGLKDTKKKLSILSSDAYSDISAELNRISSLRSEVYRETTARESALFQKMTGFIFYGQQGLSTLLHDNQWKPETGYLYNLQDMKALQTISKGILVTTNNPYFLNKVAFLYTDENFVDGQSLDGYYVFYSGTHKYQSNSGPRNVYAFKLFKYNDNQTVKGIQFYFYPQVVHIGSTDEKITMKAFGIKFQK